MRPHVALSEAVAEKPTPVAGPKKPLAPPPVGKKPGVPLKAGEVPSKPEAPKSSDSVRVELLTKDHSNNHHPPSESNKTEGQFGFVFFLHWGRFTVLHLALSVYVS